MPGREQQAAGTTAENPAAAATAGFIGWSPDPNRAIYKVGSSTKDPIASAAQSGRVPQFYR